MRGAAMSLTAATSGFVIFLLSVSVVQSQNGWGVTYTYTEICAFKGSTVDMSCTIKYPSTINGHNTTVEKTFWFKGDEIVDLITKSEYSGRVTYSCDKNRCTLRITDLRESDSAEYKFRFITNQPGGKYTGSPGVTLSVTDLQVQVSRFQGSSNWAELKCHSSCLSPGHHYYVWYKNGQNISGQTSYSYSASFDPADSFSCAVRGYEKFRSPSVYAPKLPSVSVSPSAEIVEGRSVTLTCSSDANPAATYTWYKWNGYQNFHPLINKPQLVFSPIQSSDSGEYYCAAENRLGWKTSKYTINVKYAPKLPSVSLSLSDAPKLPSVSLSLSGEIVEGSSVTLTCISEANPAATYTWRRVTLNHKCEFSKNRIRFLGQVIEASGVSADRDKVSAVKATPALSNVSEQQADTDWKPVACASRALSSTEQRYAQIEKEVLASTRACERFAEFLIGKSFHIETDHKPLIPLLGSKSLDEFPPRIQRLRMRLMRFAYIISHVAGKDIAAADVLSRASVSNAAEGLQEEEINLSVDSVMASLPATEKRLREIQRHQDDDATLQQLKKFCVEGWPDKFSIEECSSPICHFQSNGEAERAVRTIKSLLKKSSDAYLALMAYRAAPLANGYSPTELLMGRKIRSPVIPSKLNPG
ncbi:uncharacterized protein LOC123966985, partial [Micropterus dolomieu]|uniref:uncharacterized protein LOC123966985 n=1 Tax=Micropterus dolomieu TaxID=147949 RepID=UPI001E8DD7D5